MKQENKDRLTAYLLGDMPEAEAREFAGVIAASPELQQEMEGLKLVLGLLDGQPELEPSVYSREQFYQFLEMEAAQVQNTTAPTMRIGWWAAAVALLVIGLGFGLVWQNHDLQQEQIRRLSAEVVETRKLLLLAMLEDPSASERIQAMNVSTHEFQPDQRIVGALINRLQNDENVNVRLKAAEYLEPFMDQPEVVDAAIQSLELESSPEVQIMLIESLVKSQKKEAVPGLRRLLEREDVPEVVRDLAAYGLGKMS